MLMIVRYECNLRSVSTRMNSLQTDFPVFINIRYFRRIKTFILFEIKTVKKIDKMLRNLSNIKTVVFTHKFIDNIQGMCINEFLFFIYIYLQSIKKKTSSLN